MKYPFIEYLSYRLKKYGKKAYPYLMALEEETQKAGTSIDEAVKKEHFDIALRKISMGNAITSIKTLNRISMIEIFEQINGVEELLKQDPANVYDKMDYKTKILYRNTIKELSKKTKISEIYITKKVLSLARQKSEKEQDTVLLQKQSHVGYYLISEGRETLIKELTGKNKAHLTNNTKILLAFVAIWTISAVISAIFSIQLYKMIRSIILSFLLFILLLIPTQTIIVQILQYILGKIVKPKQVPKIDLEKGVPEEYSTFVVIPTILNSKEKVKSLMKNLEAYYMANKSDNIYFALLGDVTSGRNETESYDKEIMDVGLEEAKKLNEKYPYANFPRFHFLYRKRTWNAKEECFLGWERKRGLLNQFNDYILNKSKNDFLANTIELSKNTYKLPNIKYIITLDSDTKLLLNTAFELIGAMAHILNTPILNERKDCVIGGHALIQPRIGISLQDIQKSIFTKIYAGSGGKDAYTNAISDIYQDNFEEGIFTGKGIYNVEVFSKVLSNEIPENTVLSHDLLEGSYLRCALSSDIILLDGFPVGYNSFKARLTRWIRGDWQIIDWLANTIKDKKENKKLNPLNLLSKYKIFDNLIRSIQELIIIISLIYINIIDLFFNIPIGKFVSLLFISAVIPSILEIVNRILFKKDEETIQKTFTKTISGVKASIIRGLLTILSLPDKAYFSLIAIYKTIYRKLVSKKHFLEWLTSEEAEKTAKKDLKSYYQNMLPNVILGALTLCLLFFIKQNIYSIFLFIISMLWLIAPAVFWYISKEIKQINKLDKLSEQDKNYLLEIAKKTWQYFKDNLNEQTSYLPPDNYQENRDSKLAMRSSPTNIGLCILSVISSYDLKLETLNDTINLLEKILNTISNLQKWNGHLYNWYNIKTLEPLRPKYVSSVDSGNFVGYLFTAKQFLENIKNENEKIEILIKQIDKLIYDTDFSKVYDNEARLFSIGFNIEENKLTNSYYDLLASEARQTSLVAIAKKDVPAKHWNNLSRTLTILNKYKGLISWSGTAFEYLMPNINIPNYPGSLLDESVKFMLMSQKEYAKKLNLPWGISESAFNLKDLHHNYQYKAFGIPWLGLKRGLSDEMVISSYASIMAVTEKPKEVVANLKKLEEKRNVPKIWLLRIY